MCITVVRTVMKAWMGFEVIPLGNSLHSVVNFEQEVDPEPFVFVCLCF